MGMSEFLNSLVSTLATFNNYCCSTLISG